MLFTDACCGQRWYGWLRMLLRQEKEKTEAKGIYGNEYQTGLLRNSERHAQLFRRRDQVCLSQSGAEMASRPQSGKERRSRASFPGGCGSIQRALRSSE